MSLTILFLHVELIYRITTGLVRGEPVL